MVHRVHKECPPEQTIGRIRGILSELGFFPVERAWRSMTSSCHSVRLEDAVLPIGANGKGVTPPYALASAYSEFIERL